MVLALQDIYETALPKFKDYQIIQMLNNGQEDVATEMMNDWLLSSISMPQIRKLFSKLILNSDEGCIECELKNSIDIYNDDFFVKDLLSQCMVIKWIEPYVNSTLNINQMYGGKEEKFYSQSNHLKQLCDMQKDMNSKLQKTIRDYNYIAMTHRTGVE